MQNTTHTLTQILSDIRECNHCEEHLPHGCRPIVQASKQSRILIAGQAPGSKVHLSGIPFKDASGERLRHWLGVNKDEFYDSQIFAIVPMGFCYPGSGRSGDLAPRKECAPLWRDQILNNLNHIQMTLLIGQYAQRWHLGKEAQQGVTHTVKNWKQYYPSLLPLPHPSPRNHHWLNKNPWFETQLLPQLRIKIRELINHA